MMIITSIKYNIEIVQLLIKYDIKNIIILESYGKKKKKPLTVVGTLKLVYTIKKKKQ